jgi:hypothetical protein
VIDRAEIEVVPTERPTHSVIGDLREAAEMLSDTTGYENAGLIKSDVAVI